MSTSIFIIVGFGAIAIMSMVIHEVAHGYVASLCGDNTAKSLGRLTLNPLKHIDPVMTIIVPIVVLYVSNFQFVFGGAKPVPVNPYNLRHYRRDNRLVSAAGVVSNLLLAIALSVVLHLTLWTGVFTISAGNHAGTSPGVIVLGMGIIINLVLFAFNLMPIPPLDGSRLLRSILPPHLESLFNMMYRFGIIFIFILFRFFSPIVGSLIGLVWYYVLRLNGTQLDAVLDGFSAAFSFGG